MKILIPTYRAHYDLADMIDSIYDTAGDVEVIASCIEGSASQNRNECLRHLAMDEIAVMLDDDIRGFYDGWLEELTEPMRTVPDCLAVSARLLKPTGEFAQTCSRRMERWPELLPVVPNRVSVMPTAAIAFRFVGAMFDENFRGSGFEDGDWFLASLALRPTMRCYQSNVCRLIHLNEQKNQREHWIYNRDYIRQKWPHGAPVQHVESEIE